MESSDDSVTKRQRVDVTSTSNSVGDEGCIDVNKDGKVGGSQGGGDNAKGDCEALEGGGCTEGVENYGNEEGENSDDSDDNRDNESFEGDFQVSSRKSFQF
jgi:hypothetical protein